MIESKNTPVFVLCGGLGTRFREQTEFRPKPMINIGPHPILWHIMRSYAHHGFKRFVLCVGYRSEIIKEYFLNYAAMNSDFSVDLKNGGHEIHSIDHDDDWSVTVAYTSEETMTGARVARAAERYLGDAEHFAVTYGDGVADADLADELKEHLAHGRIGTVLGVNPPSRFGEIKLKGDQVARFAEKPDLTETWVNGGYFFFKREFLRYLSTDASCVLERDPLVNLAKDGELNIYRHDGYWQCMDTQRDLDQLNEVWEKGCAPWNPKKI